MRIGIAILNWNGINLLKSHLRGVVDKSGDSTIYIIDNNSDDNSLEFVKQNFPQVKLIRLDRNYGFAEGYNIGLKHVNEDIVCILNNDIEVTEKWLDPVKRKFNEKKNCRAIKFSFNAIVKISISTITTQIKYKYIKYLLEFSREINTYTIAGIDQRNQPRFEKFRIKSGKVHIPKQTTSPK